MDAGRRQLLCYKAHTVFLTNGSCLGPVIVVTDMFIWTVTGSGAGEGATLLVIIRF